ncbi:MAG: flagellar protein FlgN [Glaciimonas sp.]|nr:flagellar protein FlgN [Glaciimonas sp.]
MTSPTSTLLDEHAAASSLIRLLQKEQDTLIAANIEELPALIVEKAAIVANMAELANHRQLALATTGFSLEQNGMDQWIAQTNDNVALTLWQELLSLGKAAEELNRINGKLINQHAIYTQNALNALQGGSVGGNFYGPNGKSTMKPPTSKLIIG